ncbi:MAG: hypothetical protein V4608_10775 [Bacteroidota bacterium]
MENSNEPINPTYFKDHEINSLGLTKREYFAGLAMQAYVSGGCINQTSLYNRVLQLLGFAHQSEGVIGSSKYDQVAFNSIKQADELLKQLEQ